jgi:hypothetical protein
MPVNWSENKDEITFDFEGIGFVIRGEAIAKGDKASGFVFDTELYVDGKAVEKIKLPVNFTTRRHELAWKYQLPNGPHSVKLKVLNRSSKNTLSGVEAIIYSDKPVDGLKQAIETAGNVNRHPRKQ